MGVSAGGGKGIGLACASCLGHEGCKVVVADIDDSAASRCAYMAWLHVACLCSFCRTHAHHVQHMFLHIACKGKPCIAEHEESVQWVHGVCSKLKELQGVWSGS